MRTILLIGGLWSCLCLPVLADDADWGQDASPEEQVRHATNAVRNLLVVSPAYRAVAEPLMRSAAENVAIKLNLPETHPFNAVNAKVNLNPPAMRGMGSVSTKDFLYSFPGGDTHVITNDHGVSWYLEKGKLAYVLRKNPFARWGDGNTEDLKPLFQKLAAMPALIDTNGAYQLATQWLAAVGVDVAELERHYRPICAQKFFQDGSPRPLPIFDITWGGKVDEDSPPVWVEVFGATKELILLRMEDTRFSKLPAIMVTNAFELNGIPAIEEKQGR